MLYDLLVPLVKLWSAFNVFRYITFRTAVATVTAIVISFALGPWLIRRFAMSGRSCSRRPGSD
jgi:phospho-N-acetylmuramoyl-pentapeptide-transferase